MGAIWNFIGEYNRKIREKVLKSENRAIFSILY
jgi:hypothetical protein